MNEGFSIWINQLRLLFDDLEEILFFVKDHEGKFLHANHSHIRHLGKSSLREIVGKTDHDFYPFSLADRYSRDDREVIQSGEAMINRVEIVKNQKGEMRWHSTKKIPFKTPQGVSLGLVGFTRDLHQGSVLIQKYEGLTQVIEKIEKELCGELQSSALAKEAGVSVRQLERRFKIVFSKSPREYIIEKRLEEARRRLLKSRDKITTIAMECGFFDHSHFTNAYRRYFGLTPKEQRQSLSTRAPRA